MGSRSGLRIIRNSSLSLARKGELSCDSLASSLTALRSIAPPIAYPKGAILFREGQTACGIFEVRSGLVKLSIYSCTGHALILRIVEAGEMMGLPATLSGKPYEVTAEVTESARVNFIPRTTFLHLLRISPEAVLQVTQLLTDSHYANHEVIQSLGLSRHASEKLARFFLSWSAHHYRDRDHLRIVLTHAEIGEMIGVSRETVTRVLSIFKKKNLLTIEGGTVNICNRDELHSLAGR
jgi:CRP/FNR family cyclic AMP-dependent transcriptional regulator